VRALAGSGGPAILDAPVAGAVTGARDGTLQIFVGGPAEDYQRLRPLLEPWGIGSGSCMSGSHGAGYTVKLMLNLLWFAYVSLTAEALTIGVRAGVDVATLRRSLLASAAASHFLEHDVLSVLERGDFDDSFALALACKDLGLAVDLARQTGVPAEMSAMVEQIYRRARAQYGDDGGQMLPMKLLEDLTATPSACARATRRSDDALPLAGARFVLTPMPAAHFGAGAIGELPGWCAARAVPRPSSSPTRAGRLAGRRPGAGRPRRGRGNGGCLRGGAAQPQHRRRGGWGRRVAGLAAEARRRRRRPAGWPRRCQSGWGRHGRVAEADRVAVVAVGGGSAIDAAKGVALAAVNPQRGRDLDYRRDFARPALPIVAVPTTAGTGAETNAFACVTDPATRRKFYVGHASSRPAAAILDPTSRRPAARRHGRHRDGRPDPRAGVLHVQPRQSRGRTASPCRSSE
jgi:hypothetical protein